MAEDDEITLEWRWRREAFTLYPKISLEDNIARALDDKLQQWQPALQGVPVGYGAVRLCSQQGMLHEDMPLVHVEADVHWQLFCPRQQALLPARVISLGVDHLALRVGPFNATVAKARLPQEYEWRPEQQCFIYSGVPSLRLAPDSRVIFKVLDVETRQGVFCIIGDMQAPGTG